MNTSSKTTDTRTPTRRREPQIADLKLGRIPVLDVSPSVNDGTWPAKATVGEAIPLSATVFREGHDAVAATGVLIRPDGTEHTRVSMVDIAPGLDRFTGWVVPDCTGMWTFRVEAWSDPYSTWVHDATIKIAAAQDSDVMLAIGSDVLSRALNELDLNVEQTNTLSEAIQGINDNKRPAQARLAAGTSRAVHEILADNPLRDGVSSSATYKLWVDRPLALCGSWYEFFVRSEGARFVPDESEGITGGYWASGTFQTAKARLDSIATMGFNVAYLTPIHPIGTTFRKGPNNTLVAGATDPGSPYAIGSSDGGHDAIHPDLGTFDDFDDFVSHAKNLGLEVALDLALQCSPDHPWVTEHPEWFTTRPDGSIAYAENPPKKYQDIYPLNFDNDPVGLASEILRIVLLWVSHGVTLFRVDNPHTKPVQFWEWLIRRVRKRHPDVLFLSEAFTKPAMMRTLAKVGFHQSYTYFAWRESAAEITEYFTELSTSSYDITPDGVTGTADYMRPNVWPTTHDILTPYMTHGGVNAFTIRAVLAALASPTWGIYTGYELVESEPRPGAQEQIDNEKYQYKPRDFDTALTEGRSLAPLLTKLNEIRRANPALQQLRTIEFHPVDNENLLVFSRYLPAELSADHTANCIIVALNLDPHNRHSAWVHSTGTLRTVFGDRTHHVRDLLDEERYDWGADFFIDLGGDRVAHVIRVDVT